MLQDENVTERERIAQMLSESEDIKRFQLGFEKPSQCVTLPIDRRPPDDSFALDSIYRL